MKNRASTRVPNKNFRDLNGKPLCRWLVDELLRQLSPEHELWIDSENERVMEHFADVPGDRLRFHKRLDWFASDRANGNHLMNQFGLAHPEYDFFAQVYVTAVTLRGEVVREAMDAFLAQAGRHDSMFLVTEETGWVWYQGRAVNYDPATLDGLPRSQDAVYLKETTGLYAISREALFSTGCRVGRSPLLYPVPREFAFDIDTMEDFHEAEKRLAPAGRESFAPAQLRVS
ncbi:MAG: cytidylyltransferase domain-containing protein [Opitutaceae bacterium]